MSFIFKRNELFALLCFLKSTAIDGNGFFSFAIFFDTLRLSVYLRSLCRFACTLFRFHFVFMMLVFSHIIPFFCQNCPLFLSLSLFLFLFVYLCFNIYIPFDQFHCCCERSTRIIHSFVISTIQIKIRMKFGLDTDRNKVDMDFIFFLYPCRSLVGI